MPLGKPGIALAMIYHDSTAARPLCNHLYLLRITEHRKYYFRKSMPARKHIRLRDYDYSWQNAYFITICTKERKHYFCKNSPAYIVEWNPVTMLSPIGEIAMQSLLNISSHFPRALIDEFIIMPNHIHCILILSYDENSIDQNNSSKQSVEKYLPQVNQFSKPVKGSVSVIIGRFKAAVTKWCNNNGYEYFAWQPKFYDHVIRDAKSHESIRNYIINNPESWNLDELYNKPAASL